MKLITVVGARPQFIKIAAVSRCIQEQYRGKIEDILVHTGQHYDENMSQVFFDELNIPSPKYNLKISGGSHGDMTGRMLEAIENVLLAEKPDLVLVYGDTNSTLAGALAAAKLQIPVVHVEAGLRSFNRKMPEEINRIIVDKVSTLLFCPTETAVNNLKNEGIVEGVYRIGDVMYDAALYYGKKVKERSNILSTLGLKNRAYVLATCHRAENTEDPKRLCEILSALDEIAKIVPVVLPLHPRTQKLIFDYGFQEKLASVTLTNPLPFMDMMALEQAAKTILTDSGGVQKEAFFYRVPCITMRDETEWVETVQQGWNQLTGANRDRIIHAFHNAKPPSNYQLVYGEGSAAMLLLKQLVYHVQAGLMGQMEV